MKTQYAIGHVVPEDVRLCSSPDCEVELDPKNTSGLCKTCYQRDYMRRYRAQGDRVAEAYAALGDPDEWECIVKGCEEGGEVWDRENPWCAEHAQKRVAWMKEDLLFLEHGLRVR